MMWYIYKWMRRLPEQSEFFEAYMQKMCKDGGGRSKKLLLLLLSSSSFVFFNQRASGISPQSIWDIQLSAASDGLYPDVSDTCDWQADVRKRQSESSTEVPAIDTILRGLSFRAIANLG